jgi:hypothetical protein
MKAMAEINPNRTFSGSSWEEYSQFEFQWLEIMLAENVLDRRDIETFAEKYGIKFSKAVHTIITPSEIGNIIINDVKRNALLPAVKSLVKEKYPHLLTFEEADQIYQTISTLETASLVKIFIATSKNKGMINVMRKELVEKSLFTKEQIKHFVLEALYGGQYLSSGESH